MQVTDTVALVVVPLSCDQAGTHRNVTSAQPDKSVYRNSLKGYKSTSIKFAIKQVKRNEAHNLRLLHVGMLWTQQNGIDQLCLQNIPVRSHPVTTSWSELRSPRHRVSLWISAERNPQCRRMGKHNWVCHSLSIVTGCGFEISEWKQAESGGSWEGKDRESYQTLLECVANILWLIAWRQGAWGSMRTPSKKLRGLEALINLAFKCLQYRVTSHLVQHIGSVKTVNLLLRDPACTMAVSTAASVRSKISSTNLVLKHTSKWVEWTASCKIMSM